MVVDTRSGSKSSHGSAMSAVPLPEPPKKVYTTWPDMIRHWPKTTLCIVSNEFCERFSYYGMRTVLILYLLNVLKFTDNQSTIFFNSFTVLCYLTPMLGSIIADGYIGKFWTIFSVSIVYAIGQVILALASTKNFQSSVHPWMDLSGLIIIGFGTGGIKPCVSAFGADQFDQGQERMLSIYFSMFYFSINAGSMISTFISPIFRSQPCLGQDSCYPMAFGIPAILMIVATGIFMAGSFWYKKPPPKENIFGEVTRLMSGAIGNKFRAKEKKDHWLDHYMTGHDCETDKRCLEVRAETGKKNACHKAGLVEDVKSLLRVLVMFLPVPMFWALYDQQGSVWLIQGIQMDCRLTDTLLLLPDQMQTLNAVLILVFIPLFQVVVYPLASLCVEITPLRKMVLGGLVASLAFVIAGFVQLQVNTTLPNLPANGQAFVSVYNQMPNCNIHAVLTSNGVAFDIAGNKQLVDNKKTGSRTFRLQSPQGSKTKSYSAWTDNLALTYSGAGCPSWTQKDQAKQYKFTVESKKYYYIAANQIGLYMSDADPTKPTEGTGEFSISLVTAMNSDYTGNFAFCRIFAPGEKHYDPNNIPCNPKRPEDFYYWEIDYNDHTDDRSGYPTYYPVPDQPHKIAAYVFKAVRPGKWGLHYMSVSPKDVDHQTPDKWDIKDNITFTGITYNTTAQGAVLVLALTDNFNNPTNNQWELVQPNSVNILWQVPQIFTITAAEILFSITGYEFAYSQSAPSMKALVQALWLLTTAAGDTIIVIITILNIFDNAATEFFAYAGVMAGVIGIFALLSIFYYDYKYYTSDAKSDTEDDESSDSSCKSSRKLTFNNRGFVDDVEQMEIDETDIRM